MENGAVLSRDRSGKQGAWIWNRKLKHRLLTIIGGIEGHESVAGSTKATKYEHLLPMLAEIEDSDEIEGLLILLNTLGGDIERIIHCRDDRFLEQTHCIPGAGGGSHSIGGLWLWRNFLYRTKRHHDPAFLCAQMECLSVWRSLRNMIRTQDRITRFLAAHSRFHKGAWRNLC